MKISKTINSLLAIAALMPVPGEGRNMVEKPELVPGKNIGKKNWQKRKKRLAMQSVSRKANR